MSDPPTVPLESNIASAARGIVEIPYTLQGAEVVAPPEGLTRATLGKRLLWVFAGTIFLGLLIFAFSNFLGLEPSDVTGVLRDVLTVEAPIVTIGIAFYLGSDAKRHN
jgi:hypothetical protein